MEFKENPNNYYQKEASDIDRYLLRIISRYFAIQNTNDTAKINAIITEAMARYKASISYTNKGVNSFNNKEGVITFTLLSIKAEKAFEKKTAFNKDFGITKDTICEGNDLRLSDEREPLKHAHKLSDVKELETELKTLNQNAIRYGHHIHNNKNVIDKITGVSKEYDLKYLEQAQSELNVLLNKLTIKLAELEQLKAQYNGTLSTNIAIINTLQATGSEGP